MAHAHHHHGESTRDYFTEQLLTILVVGLIGFVAVQLYRTNMLSIILAPPFHLPVFVGGIAVLVVVAVRAVAVWREAGEVNAALAHTHHHHHDHAHHHDHKDHAHGPDCDHDHHKPGHAHGPDCDHEHDHSHAHHGHDHAHDDHGHSHDLTWVFVRMLVLVFPVSLYFMGVPNKGFSAEYLDKMLGKKETALDGQLADVAAKDGVVMSFNDLNDAGFDQAKRESMEGQTAVLEGKFRRISDKEFTLFRLKMTCCASDTIPLKVRIKLDAGSLSGFKDLVDGVKVKGQIQFVQLPGKEQYIPVIRVRDVTDIQKIELKNEYE